ncbi:APC family permease [Paenibacillus sp. GCM10012306]|uniref:APC family permease n=1 Tax=Paenibacillus sp. GCM10012306 TaxID=3317342 RepID=UPI003607A5C8
MKRQHSVKEKKLGVWTLSGLIIGPILGSGILMLPATIFELVGEWAIIAWLIIIGVSLLTAYIFGAISIRYPGDAGIANAVNSAFGGQIKVLSSLYLILGVSVGAAAVLLTASEYLSQLGWGDPFYIGYGLTAGCVLLLFCRITFVGKISLLLSTVSAVVLFTGSAVSLTNHSKNFIITDTFQPQSFGYAVLILFWAVFGWDIIGNYTSEVKDIRKTTSRGIILSFIVIAAVYLVVAAAMQWSNLAGAGEGHSLGGIMYPLFGDRGQQIIAGLGVFLCASTYLLYVGGISRLTASLSGDRILPAFLGQRTKHNTPYAAIGVIGLVNAAVILFMQLGTYDISVLVLIANSFLGMNALIGILAGIKLLKSRVVAILGIILSLFLIAVIGMYSSRSLQLIISVLCVFFIYKEWRSRVMRSQH